MIATRCRLAVHEAIPMPDSNIQLIQWFVNFGLEKVSESVKSADTWAQPIVVLAPDLAREPLRDAALRGRPANCEVVRFFDTPDREIVTRPGNTRTGPHCFDSSFMAVRDGRARGQAGGQRPDSIVAARMKTFHVLRQGLAGAGRRCADTWPQSGTVKQYLTQGGTLATLAA